ncbi:MAG: lysozyme [Ruminococcaceae bacterium]|nr:lysozyme [Oscillospiraceae bacterium]
MGQIRLPKTLLCFTLAAALCLTPAAAFTDTAGHWAEESIKKWSEEYGVLGGYADNTFQPDANITRGAFAGVLDRFLKYEAISPKDTFSDTAGLYWEDAILKLHAAGVYNGNNGEALSGSSLTRQQAVAMLARAFCVSGEETVLPYADADDIASYARNAVAEFTARGYLTDCHDDLFRPTDSITRAELVHILDNMICVLISTNEPYGQNVEGTVLVNSTEGAVLENMTVQGDVLVAPGVSGEVLLTNVTVEGQIRTFGDAPLRIVYEQPQTSPPPPQEEPSHEEEGNASKGPYGVYTPGVTTGETIIYDKAEGPIYANVEKNRLRNEDFAWDGDRLTYTGNEFDVRFGIDVSAYQNRASENQTIDWEAVAADGVEFAMVRVGMRGYSSGKVSADQFYAQNIDGAMAAGIETGVYFFSQATSVEEALEEADFVLELLKDHEINGPVAYDWEMHDSTYRVYGTKPEVATACAIAFCQRIEEGGYAPMIYASNYVGYIKYDQEAIDPYPRWLPEYKSKKTEKLAPGFLYQVDYWQFSSSCTIDGIGGHVDGNLHFIPKQ